jgi:hypothetical protein
MLSATPTTTTAIQRRELPVASRWKPGTIATASSPRSIATSHSTGSLCTRSLETCFLWFSMHIDGQSNYV